MTPDYNALDTAALVAAAEALTAGITPGAWEWDMVGLCVNDETTGPRADVITGTWDADVSVSDADAAFIAAAPALVRALVARLRECANG